MRVIVRCRRTTTLCTVMKREYVIETVNWTARARARSNGTPFLQNRLASKRTMDHQSFEQRSEITDLSRHNAQNASSLNGIILKAISGRRATKTPSFPFLGFGDEEGNCVIASTRREIARENAEKPNAAATCRRRKTPLSILRERDTRKSLATRRSLAHSLARLLASHRAT